MCGITESFHGHREKNLYNHHMKTILCPQDREVRGRGRGMGDTQLLFIKVQNLFHHFLNAEEMHKTCLVTTDHN